MSERLPLPRLEGSVGSIEGQDFPFHFPAGFDGVLLRAELTLFVISGIDPVVVELRDASGVLLTMTIPPADRSAVITPGAPVSIAAGAELILRPVDGGNGFASGLGGWLDVDLVAVDAPSGADLTTLAAVKQYQGIAGTDQDALIQSIIAEVSRKMARWMRREIGPHTVAGELHDGTGASDVLLLRHFPVTAVSAVAVDGEALAGGDFAFDAESGALYYQPGGSSSPWPAGRRNVSVTYDAGFAAVPEDLRGAARVQVVWELKRSKAHGGRLGERSTIVGDGTAQFLVDDWAPGVVEVMSRYLAPRLGLV